MTDSTSPRILVTGFEPFEQDPVNPSWEVARALHGEIVEGATVHGLQLRCVFGESLRQLQEVRTLHLRSSTPIARSPAQPAQLLEVPVRVRAVTANGTFHFSGWYRVQPSSDGRAWQIQSAHLQPTLD